MVDFSVESSRGVLKSHVVLAYTRLLCTGAAAGGRAMGRKFDRSNADGEHVFAAHEERLGSEDGEAARRLSGLCTPLC